MPGSYDRVKLRIPSLQPPFTFNKDASSQDVQKRYQELLQLGLNALNQPETLLDRTMTRAERIAYKPELNLLDTLLTEVYQFTTTEGEVAFSIKPRIYKQLRERLKKAEDNIFKHNPSLDPNELPHLPAWGPYNRDLQYWNPVDFEIVGVNYRLQVENFLIALADKLYSEGNDHNTKDKAYGITPPRHDFSSFLPPQDLALKPFLWGLLLTAILSFLPMNQIVVQTSLDNSVLLPHLLCNLLNTVLQPQLQEEGTNQTTLTTKMEGDQAEILVCQIEEGETGEEPVENTPKRLQQQCKALPNPASTLSLELISYLRGAGTQTILEGG
ncbi:hypothetical protein H1R20_g14807, partial [Candolleomyces eurysporus]